MQQACICLDSSRHATQDGAACQTNLIDIDIVGYAYCELINPSATAFSVMVEET